MVDLGCPRPSLPGGSAHKHPGKLIKARLGMLAPAGELQNISLACRRADISRSHFYVGRHLGDFRNAFGNISVAQLKEIVMQAAAKAGGSGTHVVEVVYNGVKHDVRIVISDYGFIVTAHPY